jgi:UDP-N-acetylglucosamine acyltransferase
VGSHIVLANCATLGGHVTLDDYATVGGLVGIHQFTRIGESAFLAAGAMVSLDVPPYCVATGDRAHLHGLNLIGLKRRNLNTEQQAVIKKAYRILFSEGLPLKVALSRIQKEYSTSPHVRRLAEFIAQSQRGVCRPRKSNDADGDEGLL